MSLFDDEIALLKNEIEELHQTNRRILRILKLLLKKYAPVRMEKSDVQDLKDVYWELVVETEEKCEEPEQPS